MFGHSAWDNYGTRSDSPTFAGEETSCNFGEWSDWTNWTEWRQRHDDDGNNYNLTGLGDFRQKSRYRYSQTLDDIASADCGGDLNADKPIQSVNRSIRHIKIDGKWRQTEWIVEHREGCDAGYLREIIVSDNSPSYGWATGECQKVSESTVATNDNGEQQSQDDEGQKIIWSRPPRPSQSSGSKVGLYILGGLGLLVAGYLYYS